MIGSENFAKLKTYANLEGTEIGGYVGALLTLRDFSEPHGMSEEFSVALDKELMSWLETFQKQTIIETRNVPQPDRVIQVLVWTDS